MGWKEEWGRGGISEMKLLTLSLVWVVPWCLGGSLSELKVWMTAERSLSEEGTCKCTYMLTLNTRFWCLATLYVLLAVHFWLDLAICCDRQSDRRTDLQTNMLTVGQPIELTDQRPDMFTDRQTNKQTKQTNDPTKQLYFQSHKTDTRSIHAWVFQTTYLFTQFRV